MTPEMRAWMQAIVAAWLDRTVHDGPFAVVEAFIEGSTTRAPTAIGPMPECAHLEAVARAFDLDTDERRMLWVAAAPSMSVQLLDIYRLLAPQGVDPVARLGFVCDLAADDAAHGDRLLRAATRPGGLLDSGVLRLRGAGPAPGRPVEVPPDVVAALAGDPVLPSAALSAALHEPVAPCPWNPEAQAGLDRREHRALALVGDPGSGRSNALAAARGGLMTVDVGRLGAGPAALDGLDEAERIVQLRGGHLVLDLDAACEPDDWARLGPWLSRPRDVTLMLPAHAELPRWLDHRFRVVRAPRPSCAAAVAHWSHALDRWGSAVDAPALARSLGQRFPLSRAAIDGVVAATAAGDVAGLHRAIRRHVPHALEALADRYETALTWDDVVLDRSAHDALREIELHARQREAVFDDWGLGRLLPYGRGLSCLFAGPPGTGKTMVAGILARGLDRELYRVDISRVVSKWLGETEKHLARLFDEAERAGAMLFFDEADSLFARRTEVRGSNDRHANMAVNFLLQRMEAFDGISVLATNLQAGLDDALRRRLRFTVHFTEPDAEQRAALWGKMLDGGLPVAEVDTETLGRRFRFTGALIKNAVVRAAFYAADRGCAIDTDMLLEAGRAELHGQGRL